MEVLTYSQTGGFRGISFVWLGDRRISEVGVKVLSVEEWTLEYDPSEEVIEGEAIVRVGISLREWLNTSAKGLCSPGLGGKRKGELSWEELEELERGTLRKVELEVLRSISKEMRVVDLEDYGDYRPDWEEYGLVEWSKQEDFEVKGGKCEDALVRVVYRHELV